MSQPAFLNGQLQPSIYDDVFKHLAMDVYEYVGDTDLLGWVVTKFEVSRDDICEAVSATGNPRASMAGAVVPGRYLTLVNSDGIIWAFYYPDAYPTDWESDYAEAVKAAYADEDEE